MSTRVNFLPDERFVSLRSALKERLDKMAEVLTPENLCAVFDLRIENVLRDAFDQVGADEGSVWLLDSRNESLVIAYNTGAHAEEIVGFKQPIGSGIVSTSLASEQGFAENEVYRHELHSRLLDDRLNLTTYAMIVVPFYFLNACRGVISCVQLFNVRHEAGQTLPVGPIPPGFNLEHLNLIKRASLVISDLIDYRLLRVTVGWDRH
jgi:hypothetical protein